MAFLTKFYINGFGMSFLKQKYYLLPIKTGLGFQLLTISSVHSKSNQLMALNFHSNPKTVFHLT